MISFRTHVVTLVSVMLALAVGIALGGGPLSDVRRGALTSAPAPAEHRGDAREAAYADTFAAAAAPTLYAAGLDGRPVAVVTLPGARNATVSGLVGQVEAAGGTVSGTFELQPGVLEPGEKSLVDTLGAQLADQLGGTAVDAAAPTYERLGQLLGLAVANRGQDAPPLAPGKVLSIRQSLAGAELVVSPEGDPTRGPLVLVVLGNDVDDAILAGLLGGLAQRAVGVVAVGDTGSSDLGGLRTSAVASDVATVDGSDTGLGRTTAILALIRSLETRGGSFGASGSDGAVPLR